MRKVLIIFYSQTGRLEHILKSFFRDFSDDFVFEFLEIKTHSYAPSLSFNTFFEPFTDSVLGNTCEITMNTANFAEYEYVVLGFQPWFLHVSVPFNSFIQSEYFIQSVQFKKVILIVDCRNTWRKSLEHVANCVAKCKGKVIGTFIYRDINTRNVQGAFSLLKKLKTKSITQDFSTHSQQISLIGQQMFDEFINTNFSTTIQRLHPDSTKEITSLGYEETIIPTFKKWALFINKKQHGKKRRLFLFKVWIVIAIIFAAPFVAKKHA